MITKQALGNTLFVVWKRKVKRRITAGNHSWKNVIFEKNKTTQSNMMTPTLNIDKPNWKKCSNNKNTYRSKIFDFIENISRKAFLKRGNGCCENCGKENFRLHY